MRLHLLGCTLATTMVLGACAESPKPTNDDFGYKGTGIAVNVAPLTLESLSDACYSFTVVNGAGDLVVGRGPGAIQAGWGAQVTGTAANTVCASQFGNGAGGDASYVAPCDAQEAAHEVTLWVDALCDSGFAGPLNKAGSANWAAASPNNSSGICTEIQPYQNPCGDAGCTLPVTCVENADTPVTFNFTIMGQADQGFFDIAVNFSDIFCSAKLDTCYGDQADSQPIQMLFDPITKERINTAVLALACTAGSDAAGGTYLHMGNVEVTCDGNLVATLDLSTVTQEGNQTAVGNIVWAAYFGSEALTTAGGDSWNKEFFNIAVAGFGANCSVSWVATASEGPDLSTATSATANTYNTYPVINYDDTVTGADSAWLCDQNGLNDPGSGVVTGNPNCTTPGGCLEGPCATLSPDGTVIDCEDGVSQDCAEAGITVVLSGEEIQYDGEGTPIGTATMQYTFFLPAGAIVNGETSYAQALNFNGDGESTLTVANAGGLWQFTISEGVDSDVLGSSANLFGAWTYVAVGDGIDTMTVTCGGAANYACAEWVEMVGETPTVITREFFWVDYVSPTQEFHGWGLGEGGGVYHDGQAGSTWQINVPSEFNADSGIVAPGAPWGTYTTEYLYADPTYTGPMSYEVTVSAGLCDGVVDPVDPVTPATSPVFTMLNADGWRVHHTDTTTTPPLATWTNMNDGTPNPYPAQAPRVDGTDYRSGAVSKFIAFNTNPANTTPLALGVFDNAVLDPLGGGYTLYTTTDAWGAVAGIAPVPDTATVFIAPGVIEDAGGGLNQIAMHTGRIGNDTGFHFYRLRMEPSPSTTIAVTHIGFVVPEVNALTYWGGVNARMQRSVVSRQTGPGQGIVAVVGPFMKVGQIEGFDYVNTFNVDFGAGTFTDNTSAQLTQHNISLAGWQGVNYLAFSQIVDGNPSPSLRIGALNVATGAISSIATGFVGVQASNFSAYAETTGVIYGFWASTNLLGFHTLGTAFPTLAGTVSPANYFTAPNKFFGVGWIDWVHP